MNTQKVQLNDVTTEARNTIDVTRLPNECPVCCNKIKPRYVDGFLRRLTQLSYEAQLIFLCPADECRAVFIGYFHSIRDQHGIRYTLRHCEPKQTRPVVFSDIIKNTSQTFPVIYNQAHTAEENDLKDICGAGYRKALEFLIKDYLSGLNPKDQAAIKKEALGNVIERRVEHVQLKDVAERATWLGNDETHYERRWEDKDLKDLKILIDLAVRWIEMNKMSEQAKKDMPNPKGRK